MNDTRERSVVLQSLTKKLFYLLRLTIAVVVLWYLASTGSIEWSSFSGLAGAWRYTLMAIGLFVVATILQALRLQLLIRAYHFELSFSAATKLTFIGLFFSTYLPGAVGGDLVKIYYANKGIQGGRTEVTTILLLDRFVGLFSLLTLPILLAPFFLELIMVQPILQALLGASSVVACGIILTTLIGARFKPPDSQPVYGIESKRRFGKLAIRILRTLHFYHDNAGLILGALSLSYALHLLMVGVSMAIAQATNSAGADPKMLLLIPMGYLANSLPITPGGLGVGEAALESLFTMSGLSGGAETILGWRLIMILVGLVGLVFYLRGEKRFVFNPGTNEISK